MSRPATDLEQPAPAKRAPRADSAERSRLAEQAATFLSAMQQLHQGIASQLAPVLENQHGIDFRLYFLLKHIEMGAIHPGAISKAVHLPNSVITRHLDQLVERGLLQRSLDPDDSRRIKLTLTKDGLRVAKDANRTVCNIVGSRLERLPAARRDAFLASFAELSNE